ncbi:MAG: hypothetical protein IPL61_04890 [Myxococcales bacterium]|nr:hypothetical protein [Myxococcales bacterium]
MNSKRSYPLRTWLARLARLALVPIWLVATAHAARADHFCGYLSSEWVNHGKNPICNDLQSFYTYHVYSYCCTGRLLYDNVIANSCHYPWSISPPPSQGECVATQVPCPECDEVGETCDGIDEPGATRADDQCGDDEEGCAGRNRDGNPVRYEDGSVESQVHVLAAVPGNGALGLNYAIQYQSRLGRRPAGATADFFKDQHFLGHGWSDSFSDRLIVPTEPGESSVWMSLDRTVSFDPADAGDSDGGRYHLTDRGATQSPRWVIESRERGTVKQTWEFNDASTHPSGPRRGLLVGRSATGFRLDIARVSATDSRITTVIDSLGRRLTFTYQATTGASWIWRLDHVTYQTMLGTTATTIAQFSYGTSHRLDEVATPTDYLRFNYLDDYPTPCAHCEALLTEIIAPASADGASPLPGTPPQPHERVIEGHAFEVLGDGTPRAVESWGPTTHWAYQYVDGAATRQLDLLQPKEACPSGTCPDGQACQTTAADPDGTCYVVNIRDLIDGSVWNVDRGGLPDENESYIYDGDTPIATYARGIITSYRFNDDGTIRCLVRNDDDTEALDEQGQCGNTATGDLVQVLEPSWSVGPGGAEIHDVTLPSALVAGGTRSSTDWYDEHGLRSLHQRWGWTQDRAGVTWPRAEATRYDYDAIGRLVRIDGPLDNNEAYDVVETEYHGAGPDLGHVRYSRRFSGTEWVHTTFTTEYLEYDLRGIPHRIVGPDGVETRLATPDGLSWTATEDATGSPVVSTIELNPDGSVRSQVDADGVCLTYQIDARAARRSPSEAT